MTLHLGRYSCVGPETTLLVRKDIVVRTTTPEDWTFLNSLMKAESSKVGFLQERTWHNYVWGGERNFVTFLCLVNRDPVGYVFLTPGIGVNRPVHIQQIVIRHDARRLEYGTALVDVCADFCLDHHRSGILLRCRADLEANLFWNALGFRVSKIFAKGSRNHMGFVASDNIVQYEYPTGSTLFDEAKPMIYIQSRVDPAIFEHGNLSFMDRYL